MDADFDAEFDALLDSAAPRALARTAQLDELLDELVIGATASGSGGNRGWSRRRTGFISVGLVAAAGIGVGAAAATGILSPSPQTSDWFTEDGVAHVPVVLSSGKTCDVTIAPVPREASSTGIDQWNKTLGAAHTFMRGLDPASVSQPAAVAAYRAANGAKRSGTVSDGVRIRAVAAAIHDRMHAALVAGGLPADSVTVATREKCRGTGQ